MPMFFQSVRHASSVEGYENLGGTYLRPPASMHNERTSKTLFIRRHIRMIISAIGHSLLVRSCPSLYHMCQCPLGFVVDAKSFSNFFICSLYGQPAQSGRSPWVRCEVPDAGNGTRDTARKSRKKASPRRLHTAHTMRTIYTVNRSRNGGVSEAKKNPCNIVAGGIKVMRVDLAALLARHFPRHFLR